MTIPAHYRKQPGRPRKFESADALWTKCVEYFEWAEANPLSEAKAFPWQGDVRIESLPKLRALTITGLCVFLDIDEETWRSYRKRKGFGGVTTRAERIIYAQKFEGAAAELLNHAIIARDLGLADKKELSGGITVNKVQREIIRPDPEDTNG